MPIATRRVVHTHSAILASRLHPTLRFLILTAIFSISYTQAPLYTSNQNQYFLHGYARGGRGFLAEDWLANTLDPTPVFSGLITFIAQVAPVEALFYLFYALQLGVYLFSLFGILDPLFGLRPSRVKSILFLALLTLVHSAAWRFTLSRTLGANWSYILEDGVADQRLLGSVFEPSTFGVLLVFSIYVFLRHHPYWAAVLAALAATFHPTYLLSAGVLTAAYMGITFFEGLKRQGHSEPDSTAVRVAPSADRPAEASTPTTANQVSEIEPSAGNKGIPWKAVVPSLRIGMVALVAVTPILAYVYLNFGSTPPETTARAQEILVNYRIPHHARPDWWFDATAVVKILLVAAALYTIRRTRLFLVLLVPTLVAAGLTLLQVLTGSVALALIFPWRISTFVVPLSTAVLLAWLVEAIWGRIMSASSTGQNLSLRFSLGVMVACVLVGAIRFALDLQRKTTLPERELFQAVAASSQSGQVYLTPVKMQDFRLATGAPAYVDFKSIPYRDTDVLEWRRRLELADTFYKGGACEVLEILAGEGVTHAVLPAGSPGRGCSNLNLQYSDTHYAVMRISEP